LAAAIQVTAHRSSAAVLNGEKYAEMEADVPRQLFLRMESR
jgi:hypothetical protein